MLQKLEKQSIYDNHFLKAEPNLQRNIRALVPCIILQDGMTADLDLRADLPSFH